MSNEIKYSIKRGTQASRHGSRQCVEFPLKESSPRWLYVRNRRDKRAGTDGLSRGGDGFSAVFRLYLDTVELSLLVDSDESSSDEYEASARKGIDATCTRGYGSWLHSSTYIFFGNKPRYENPNDRSSFPKTEYPSGWLSCAPPPPPPPLPATCLLASKRFPR